jgi:hypothetical protein
MVRPHKHGRTDKQRMEKLGGALARLRTKVALPIYQEMSDLAYLREQKQDMLDGVNMKIEKMERRIFELKFELNNYKLVDATLDPDVEIRLLQMQKLEWLEDENVDQNDDDNDDDDIEEVNDNVDQNDEDNDVDDDDDDDDDGKKEVMDGNKEAACDNDSVDVISVSSTGDSNDVLGGRKKKRKTFMNGKQAHKKLSDFFFRLKISEG